MPSPTSKKILIVEDEPDILQLVKLYLEKDGFQTVSAKTGMEGLQQVKQEKPDLVVLDLMLPEIDGLEVCKRLRSAPSNRDAPHHHADSQSRRIGYHHWPGAGSR